MLLAKQHIFPMVIERFRALIYKSWVPTLGNAKSAPSILIRARRAGICFINAPT